MSRNSFNLKTRLGGGETCTQVTTMQSYSEPKGPWEQSRNVDQKLLKGRLHQKMRKEVLERLLGQRSAKKNEHVRGCPFRWEHCFLKPQKEKGPNGLIPKNDGWKWHGGQHLEDVPQILRVKEQGLGPPGTLIESNENKTADLLVFSLTKRKKEEPRVIADTFTVWDVRRALN